MSTPQNPDGGDTPQDPSDPQNPYGTPPSTPPPPPTTPPPPPSTPPPAAPPPPPSTSPAAPPSDPVPPTTSIPPVTPVTPAADSPAAPPPYGQPTYGQPPAYGQQPAYGQPPAYPQTGPMPGQDYVPPGPGEAGKGMAIGALVASILGCTCLGILVAVPLAIVVLVRGRDGRNHGKGLAIAALALSLLWVVGGSIGGYFLYDYAKDLKSVNDLRVGDCITAHGLNDEKADTIDTIRTVDCSTNHDAEVVSSVTMTADQATQDATAQQQLCINAIDATAYASVLNAQENYSVTSLTVQDPGAGDRDACVISKSDGSKLTAKLGS